MKKYLLTLLLAVVVIPASPRPAAAQTADAVVEKYLAAMGGREALAGLTSRKATGTVTLTTPAGDVSGPIEVNLKAPNKSRVLMTVDLTALGAGQMTIEQRFDGTVGSAMNSVQGNVDLTGRQLENLRNNVFPTPLLTYKTAGTKIEMLPNAQIGGRDMVVLLATPKAGSPIRMYLDAETSLIARTVMKVEVPQVGSEVEQTSEFSDYRTVDAVKVPFKVVNTSTLQTLTITLSKVEHNIAIDEALFVKK
jgi:outer membrane lipoprotein-sorting protein